MRQEELKQKMSTETKDQLTPEEEARLSQLAEILQTAYNAREDKTVLENITGEETLAKRFQDPLKERLPSAELREEVSQKIERWKKGLDSKVYSQDEIDRYVKETIIESAKLYMDSAKHILMYNRQYVEDRFENDINDIVEKTEQPKVEDFYGIALISFDLNGLKTLNDANGHEMGNRALEIFSKILKEGTTTEWLKKQGVEVVPARQSGDEFLFLMRGEKDLSLIIEETKRRFDQEVKDANATELMSFADAKRYLEGLKIWEPFLKGVIAKNGVEIEGLSEDDFKKEMGKAEADLNKIFKFKMGTSVGIATLGEAMSRITPEELTGKTYKQIARRAIGETFNTSDEKAMEHKKRSKAALADIDPLLAILYNRSVAVKENDNEAVRAELVLKNATLETELEETKVERDEIKQTLEKERVEKEEMKKLIEELRRKNTLLELNKIQK